MDAYGAALFIHLLAIISAAVASGLVHLAESRISRATTVRDALEWMRFAGITSRVFPLVVLVLVASGGFMVSWQHRWAWQLGWVRAGVLGAIILMANGIVIGARSKRLAMALAAGTSTVMHDAVARTLGWTNTCLALGVVFTMAVKPSTVGSLVALGVFASVGAAIGASRGRVPVTAAESVAA